MIEWYPTHRITDDGQIVEVMLVEGSGYTRSEWASETDAHYECSVLSREWTFQGHPFSGTVQRLDSLLRHLVEDTPTHGHTCLNCSRVIETGEFDCDDEDDHDFALCDECVAVGVSSDTLNAD